MRVKELIEILSTYNPNAEVKFRYDDVEYSDLYEDYMDTYIMTEVNIDKYDSNERRVILTNINYNYFNYEDDLIEEEE